VAKKKKTASRKTRQSGTDLPKKLAALRTRKNLTDDEKCQAIYDLKGKAIVQAFAPQLGQRRGIKRTFTRGDLTLTIARPPTYDGMQVTFREVELKRDGIPIPLKLPIHIRPGSGGALSDPRNHVRDVRDVIMGLGD
jgi:hypothetical protein